MRSRTHLTRGSCSAPWRKPQPGSPSAGTLNLTGVRRWNAILLTSKLESNGALTPSWQAWLPLKS
jgi:hypothetical protein